MNRHDAKAKKIMALAYMHRYGWIAAMVLCTTIWTEKVAFIVGVSTILFSVWSFVGYQCKWKHIFCSYQNAYYQRMTPHSVKWHLIKKRDAYGIPLIFLVLGIVMLYIGMQMLSK
jgi:hypothetical protein